MPRIYGFIKPKMVYLYLTMIHILHTADLHLGKVIFERSLLEDQQHILTQLMTEACKKDKEDSSFFYSALIISGDIYDRSIPPSQAVTLFDDFLTLLHRNHPELHIFLIPGNHDSAQRLSYASRILEGQNIHIASSSTDIASFTIINKGSESLAVFQIPFLTPSFYDETEENETHVLRSQGEIMHSVMKSISSSFSKLPLTDTGPIPCIASAHVFTIGSQTSDSERIFLGTAEHINSSVFSPFSYTALGHIHKPQKVNNRCYYAGSPLAYSFSEAGIQKNFLHIAVNCNQTKTNVDKDKNKDEKAKITPFLADITVESIPIRPLHKAIRLKGSFSDFYKTDTYENNKNDYIEITFTDKILVENPMMLLKQQYPYLLSINQSEALQTSSTTSSFAVRKTALSENKSLENIFEAFALDVLDDSEKKNTIEELTPIFIAIAKDVENKEDR